MKVTELACIIGDYGSALEKCGIIDHLADDLIRQFASRLLEALGQTGVLGTIEPCCERPEICCPPGCCITVSGITTSGDLTIKSCCSPTRSRPTNEQAAIPTVDRCC